MKFQDFYEQIIQFFRNIMKKLSFFTATFVKIIRQSFIFVHSFVSCIQNLPKFNSSWKFQGFSGQIIQLFKKIMEKSLFSKFSKN